MGSIENFKPLIRKGAIVLQNEGILYESTGGYPPIALPRNAKDYLKYMDGSHTVQDIVRLFWAERGHVHFKELFLTLQRLKDADVLINGYELTSDIETEENRYERTLHKGAKPFFEIALFDKWEIPTKHRLSFSLFSIGVLAVGLLMIFKMKGPFIQSDFLKVGDSYARGLLLFFLTASILTTLKNILKTFLLSLAEGRVFGASLQMNILGLTYRIEDEPSLLALTRGEATLYGLAVLSSHFFWLAALHFFSGSAQYFSQLFPIAVLLTVFDTDPYTKSELTMLFKKFSSGEDFHELTPYFRKRSLLSVFDRGTKIKGEILLIAFSTFAISWTFFAYYCSLSLKEIVPNLVLSLDSPLLINKVPTFLVLGGLILLNMYMILDIFTLVASNLLHPFTNVVYKFWTSIGSSEANQKDVSHIQNCLHNLPYFEDLTKTCLPLLLEQGRLTNYNKGTRLIIQGTTGTELFILLEGRVQIRKREESGRFRNLVELQAPTVFGEAAVLTGVKRTADVVALTKIEALVITKSALEHLRLMGAPQDYAKLIQKIQLQQAMASSMLFKDMPHEVIHLFTHSGKIESILHGTELMRQGAEGDSFYFLVRGSVSVQVDGRELTRLEGGSFFGEISLLTKIPRTATVKAEGDCLVFKMGRDEFWSVLAENINLGIYIETVAELRLKDDSLLHSQIA